MHMAADPKMALIERQVPLLGGLNYGTKCVGWPAYAQLSGFVAIRLECGWPGTQIAFVSTSLSQAEFLFTRDLIARKVCKIDS